MLTDVSGPHEIAFTSPAAPLSLELTLGSERFCARSADEVGDEVIADLVRKRLAMERGQGWAVLGLFVAALAAVVAIGTRLNSQVFLGVTAALTASLALGLGFSVERVFWRLFLGEGRAHGLNEAACRRIFERASGAEKMIEVMRSCGKEPTDTELARFVR